MTGNRGRAYARPVPVAADGFHHPASEQELADLVKAAYREGRLLRVRGAAHSVSHAVYTEPPGPNRVSQQSPPAGDNINVMLDRYRGWRVKDEARKLVEADAGIHLGADPSDPTGTATLETSLLCAARDSQKRWTLSDTGGVTHQTVSGFTATGVVRRLAAVHARTTTCGASASSTGRARSTSSRARTPTPTLFYAMSPNLGLLGVVSTITFECTDLFAIEGRRR